MSINLIIFIFVAITNPHTAALADQLQMYIVVFTTIAFDGSNWALSRLIFSGVVKWKIKRVVYAIGACVHLIGFRMKT